MSSRDVWICRTCGSRNKLRWEYCARCGEAAAEAAAEEPLVTETEEVAEEPASPPAGSSVVGTVLLGVAIVLALRWSWSEAATRAPERPDPALFVAATLPTPEPSIAPRPRSPQEDDYARGMALFARNDLAAALPLLAAAAEADPRNATYRNAYGRALWAAGRLEDAIAHFEVAAQVSPGGRNTLDLAKARDAAGQSAAAAVLYEQLIASEPGNEDALEALASLQDRTGQRDAAVRTWRALAERRPRDPIVAQYLGQALEATGDVEAAVQAYRQVLARVPHATVTRGTLAEALFKQGRVEEALVVYQEGLQADGAAAALYRGMGTVLERAGRLVEAAAAYREYGRRSPSAADAAQLEEHAARLEQRAGGASS